MLSDEFIWEISIYINIFLLSVNNSNLFFRQCITLKLLWKISFFVLHLFHNVGLCLVSREQFQDNKQKKSSPVRASLNDDSDP